jgi:hypothetical protein
MVGLYWLPLGAGGHFVRLNGRIYETIVALRDRRTRRDLYHSALIVTTPDGRYVIESAPIPDGNGPSRGVVVEGPVGSRVLGRWRLFRYEVRCWRDGELPDAAEAVASPQCVADDPESAQRVLELVRTVPAPVWGRDELRAGEMWNSNSIVAWLLVRAGVDLAAARLPRNGRAPGWEAGLAVARRSGDTAA